MERFQIAFGTWRSDEGPPHHEWDFKAKPVGFFLIFHFGSHRCYGNAKKADSIPNAVLR
jgi:hypothetical protein